MSDRAFDPDQIVTPGGRRQGKTISTTTPLHLQRREAAERVRIARTIAAAFPSDENTADLAAAMDAFNKLTGREGFEQGKVPK